MTRRGSIFRPWPAILPAIALALSAMSFLSSSFVSSAFAEDNGSAPALGSVSPGGTPSPDASGAALRDRLFAALKNARDETEGRLIETEIWRFFLASAPDSATRGLVDEAMRRRAVYDLAGAKELLDRAIARAPDYAEAYNQRGFVRFMQDDFEGALQDVDKAIELEPKHFAAMSGRALILLRQGRFELAQVQLREAVAIHPFLKERSMIVPAPADSSPKGAKRANEVDL